MIELTPVARQRLDAYLQRIRYSFRGSRGYAVDDVEQSVREHVDVALAGVPGPVDADLVDRVLERLGPPERWIPDDERPAWKRVMERLRSGPEDWRLAYLAFGLFMLIFFTAAIGGVLLIIPAYIFSRAYVEFMREKGEPIGARRWLVYPPIALVLILGVAILIVGPVPGFIAWGAEAHGFEQMRTALHTGATPVRFNIGVITAAFGLWWIVGSLCVIACLRLVRAAFIPLTDGLEKRHVAVLTAIGIAAIFAALGVIYY